MAYMVVSRNTIEGVFSTEKELHDFLTVQMEYFLPQVEYINIEWLSEIWQGKNKVSNYVPVR